MESPLISLIIPIFNSEKYLVQCLESVINQTYYNLEIICVNDGSTDMSFNILSKYKVLDNRIKIVSQNNSGTSIARNSGVAVAKGDYISFLDSDDWLSDDYFQIMVNHALRHNADLVLCGYIREYNEKSLSRLLYNELTVFQQNQCKLLLRRIIGPTKNELSHPEMMDSLSTIGSKLYRADIIKNYSLNFVDLKHIGTGEDMLFLMHYSIYVDIAVFIDKAMYHYRRNNGASITRTYKSNLYSQWSILFNHIQKFLIDNYLSPDCFQALNNRISLSILGLGLNILSGDGSEIWKIHEIKKIIQCDRYREACKDLDLNFLPIHWKLFYCCSKHNFAFGIYALLLIITKAIGRV